ncbi:MAG: hypothetical protein RL036_698 [Actinomycetota bacterium]|jgi:hypothetical protein
MDWYFFVDFENPTNAIKPLAPGDEECLVEIARLGASLGDHTQWTVDSWNALAEGLKVGKIRGIADFRLEEASGLRGQFMLDLIAGEVNLENLVTKALSNR